MARLGMVIDLKRCIGCHACTIACKAENSTPPGVFWGRVLEREEGRFPSPKVTFLPVLCNHCKEAPCVRVCPSKATQKRADGIVTIDYIKCVGCRACITACPYRVRYFRRDSRSYFPQGLTPLERVGYQKYPKGVVTKCDFCSARLEKGLQPACVQTCITNCRYFGDLEDPTSEVSRLLKVRHSFHLLPELGTEPSVYYLS